MFESIFNSFVLVAVSEMGDKTQLLAFSLAARFNTPGPILAGILAATLLNHALASVAGSWVSMHVPGDVLAYLLAATFIGFEIWTLNPDTLNQKNRSHRLGPFLTTTILFFLAEMGDKTQLATVALGARYQSIIAVTLGTTAGMMLTDGLAVLVGEKLAQKVQMKWIRWFAAGLFFAFGIASLVTGLAY